MKNFYRTLFIAASVCIGSICAIQYSRMSKAEAKRDDHTKNLKSFCDTKTKVPGDTKRVTMKISEDSKLVVTKAENIAEKTAQYFSDRLSGKIIERAHSGGATSHLPFKDGDEAENKRVYICPEKDDEFKLVWTGARSPSS